MIEQINAIRDAGTLVVRKTRLERREQFER